jgi:tetraacyldisaccharide 4'-kinase
VPGTDDWRRVGDETVLLSRRFEGPVIVARRRADGGALACRALGADTLVLDDGFQHLALARDFDLVCFRAGSSRNASCLPAGRFREPLSALSRADAVLFTKAGEEEASPDPALVSRLDGRPLFRGTLDAVSLVTADGKAWRELPLGLLGGRRALVVSGIADREPFYRLLQEWEAQPVDFLEFPDHHAYTSEDWKAIASRARDLDLVVTTEKDLVKLGELPFAREKLVAVRVAMEIEDGERLLARIEEAILAAGGGDRS